MTKTRQFSWQRIGKAKDATTVATWDTSKQNGKRIHLKHKVSTVTRKNIWQVIVRKLPDREARCFADFAKRRDILKILSEKYRFKRGCQF